MGLNAVLLVLLPGLVLVLVLAQPPCPTGASPPDLTPPRYQDRPAPSAAAGFMSPVVRSFLHTVQPNLFPKDLLLKLLEDPDPLPNQEEIREVLVYEIGFLVCVAIGVLYVLLMPVVGLFLACCRCCGNCGGHMYQNQSPRVHCQRRGLYWATLSITLIILAGNICMFQSNESLKEFEVDQSPLDNLHTYLTTVPQEIDQVLNESYKTVDEVSRHLNDVGPLLGRAIQRGLEGHLGPALQSVRNMSQVADTASVLLGVLSGSLSRLQSSVEDVQANVSAVRNAVNITLNRPSCLGCTRLVPELDRLTLHTQLTIPNLSDLQSAVDKVIKADLSSKANEAEDFFQNIPQRVTDDTRTAVQRVKQQLEDIKLQVSRLTADLPVSTLNNISTALDQARAYINTHSPEIERAAHIRWSVGVALCCVVLLVVLCNLLGLVLGPAGLKPKVDPTKRSAAADCGGTFLMMGAGFSFLFSWLFMVLVVLLFLLGGNLYTLVCLPWHSGEMLQFMDTPGLIPGFNLAEMLGLKSKLTLTEIYTDCEKNQPLWSTLRLYELIDLNDLLNVSKYTEQIQQHFESADITLSTITLLTPEVRAQLHSLSDQTSDISFSGVTQQINTMSSINLNTTADQLDQLANQLDQLANVQPPQPNPINQAELRSAASDLRKIQRNIEATINPQLMEINATIVVLRIMTTQINGTVGAVLSTVGTTQDFLNTNTTLIVKTESGKFLDCQMGYFRTFADWANLTITQQLGRCGPVAGAVDSAEIILCSQIVESLNAFWFSLGWCLLFLIPSIILSIKLAKYYRRMKHSDVFDDHIAMNHIPRAQIKPY